MSCELSYRRLVTPPASQELLQPHSAGSGRYSSYSSSGSRTSSPKSVDTHLTSPPRSPHRNNGPTLLPKIRYRDQTFDSAGAMRASQQQQTSVPWSQAHNHSRHLQQQLSSSQAYQDHQNHNHRKSSSLTSNGFPITFDPNLALPSDYRRSASPFDNTQMRRIAYPNANGCNLSGGLPSSSLSSSSALPATLSVTNSENVPSLSHSRSTSISSSSRAHSRNSSATSNLTEASIRKYIAPSHAGIPEYASPAPQPMPPTMKSYRRGSPSPFASSSSSSRSAQSHSTSYRAREEQARPQHHRQQQQNDSFLSPELLFDNYAEEPPSTTLLQYLTAPNPSPALVRYTQTPSHQFDMHYWWDVRNIRPWTDFNVETVRSIPGLASLLEFPIPKPALAATVRPNLCPDNVSALHSTYSDFYATKINAALKVALGKTHLNMRSQKNHAGMRQQPDFVSTCDYLDPSDEGEDGSAGDGSGFTRGLKGDSSGRKGRIVGLVRSYDQWNSGMHCEGSSAQIDYLRELSLLHRYMREHSCRYGFIMTEIELVCVRAGTELVPHYGLLELAPPIQLKTHGAGEMTAGLALWYLHMLAKNQNLPGQCGWKTDVGGAVAQTRHKHLERDAWILKPEGKEKRDAKRNRGFVWPSEPLSRKEYTKPKRSTKW